MTDYRHYDTIYTERYLWTPQGNKEGYDAGSAVALADKLKGRLMLYYGTADDNVYFFSGLKDASHRIRSPISMALSTASG